MTNEQINIAIAEACGWKPTTDGGICWDCNGAPIVTPPDYCNDLNAMHEAEKKLTEKRLQTYLDFLADAPRDDVYQTWTGSVFATARQRAKAFLKTIGKWEGGTQ